jgi:DNA (cytosine-5)-methyltransferase 1
LCTGRNCWLHEVIVLDGCCGGGGAARGYVQAGHVVIGVDKSARLRADYLKSGAAKFHAIDILEALAGPLARAAHFIHVSPPCQRYSRMANCRPGVAGKYPDLIAPVRELLEASGKPWVIENVPGAPLRDPMILCGWQFGREMYRHRLFEFGGGFRPVSPPAPPAGTEGRRRECGWPHPVPAARAGHWEPGKFVSVSGHERRGPVNAAMGIDWMREREDVAEAVPPAFTYWIGSQLG